MPSRDAKATIRRRGGEDRGDLRLFAGIGKGTRQKIFQLNRQLVTPILRARAVELWSPSIQPERALLAYHVDRTLVAVVAQGILIRLAKAEAFDCPGNIFRSRKDFLKLRR